MRYKKIDDSDSRLIDNPPWKDKSLTKREAALKMKELFPDSTVKEIVRATAWKGYTHWSQSDQNRNNTRKLSDKIAEDKRTFIKNIKKEAGGCKICGYSRCLSALEFHHIDPTKKEAAISKMLNLKNVVEELKNCVLLCSNCHREVHEGLTELPPE